MVLLKRVFFKIVLNVLYLVKGKMGLDYILICKYRMNFRYFCDKDIWIIYSIEIKNRIIFFS